jgi:hypothetical protein
MMLERGLLLLLLISAAASLPADVDEVVPETLAAPETSVAPKEWKKLREQVWAKHGPELAQNDKAMYSALKAEITDPDSPQWSRFFRHKNLIKKENTKPGHKWTSHQGESRQGILFETSKAPPAMAAASSGEGLCDPTVKQHHGYFNIDKLDKKQKSGRKNYFYWLFESRENPETAPTILWLTGGPGCSSMLALLGENGPCTVAKDGKKTIVNKQSWNKKANILFVDQPAGTGFSYGDYDSEDHNEKEVSRDLYHFIQELVKVHPKYH